MSRQLDRRELIKLTTAVLAFTGLQRTASAEPPTAAAVFHFRQKPLGVMPLDFNGLSYESPQLANSHFFSSDNEQLVALFRELAPTGGVLRTGGNLSAFTGWRDHPSPLTPTEQAGIDKGKHYWEWDLCDPLVRNGNHEAVFTPASIEALAGFLKATGWKLLYGLNFGTGTPEQAAAEAACVQRLVGKNLLAFQLGNEIDFWGGGLRPKSWDFESYYAEWKQWVSTIHTKAPNAPMGGPDVAIRLDWMEKLAEEQGNRIAVLTKHHYAMGPAGDPKMDATHLLGPDPDVAKEITSAQRAKNFAGVGFRTSECNSCYHGGQKGVSNAYASALWGADYMLTLAQGGHAGVNLHGGGEGIYSPITGDPTKGFVKQPLYFGMQFAQQFAGATLLESSISAGNANITGYAARQDSDILVALINKDSLATDVTLASSLLGKAKLLTRQQLSAPSLDSRTGIKFEEMSDPRVNPDDPHPVRPYSAILLRFSGSNSA